MSPAARELGILAHAKQRERILAKARQIRRETGQSYDPRLNPTLVLGMGDRVAPDFDALKG